MAEAKKKNSRFDFFEEARMDLPAFFAEMRKKYPPQMDDGQIIKMLGLIADSESAPPKNNG